MSLTFDKSKILLIFVLKSQNQNEIHKIFLLKSMCDTKALNLVLLL